MTKWRAEFLRRNTHLPKLPSVTKQELQAVAKGPTVAQMVTGSQEVDVRRDERRERRVLGSVTIWQDSNQ